MAWTSPMTAVANSVFTAAQFNTNVRDNLNETAPAKATTAGSLFVATGSNSIAERIPTQDSVLTGETTTATSFTDLTTPGPSVTVTTATKAIVLFGCQISNNTGGERGLMSAEVSGASSIPATNVTSLMYESGSADDVIHCGLAILRDDLTPGSNVFTAKYRVTGGTGTFDNRRIAIIPL